MSPQTLLSIFASSIGFVSAIWFGIGALLISPSRIVTASDDSWDANTGIDEALISQSAEYLAGGILLAISFALQIISAQASSTATHWECQVLQSVWLIAPIGVMSSLAISYPAFLARRKFLRLRVGRLKAKRVSQ